MKTRKKQAARGDELVKRWKIPAITARFHQDGTFFTLLKEFPSALCDCDGYVVFTSKKELDTMPGVKVYPETGRIATPHTLKAVYGYTRCPDGENVIPE